MLTNSFDSWVGETFSGIGLGGRGKRWSWVRGELGWGDDAAPSCQEFLRICGTLNSVSVWTVLFTVFVRVYDRFAID